MAEGLGVGMGSAAHWEEAEVVGVGWRLSNGPKGHSRETTSSSSKQVAHQVAIAVENALEYERAIKDRDNKEARQRLYLEEEIRAQSGAIVGGESPALKAAFANWYPWLRLRIRAC